MATDWNLIRTLMNAAIDACESVDNLGINEKHRAVSTDVNGAKVTIWDFLQSAWTYPESVKDRIVVARAQHGNPKPCMNEQARTLIQTASVCAELVGA